jgi:L-fuculose-phosphate aldolase
VKKEIIRIGEDLARRQYHAALAGNISARLSQGLFLCTRHRADIGKLTVDDIVLCDMAGNRLEGKAAPTSELEMHRVAYEERKDIGAVIHGHPPTATAFAATSTALDELMLPEMVALLGPVAMVPYATPGSKELAELLRPFLRAHDAFLLENHGALTVGRNLREAALRMDLIEHNAQITLLARQLGKMFVLKPEEREALMKIRHAFKQRENI